MTDDHSDALAERQAMSPDEFNDLILKLESGELSDVEAERLKAAAAAQPDAAQYLDAIERTMASAEIGRAHV